MSKQHHRLINAMQNGAIVITPNNRLSHALLNASILASEAICIDKPRCLPYNAFLRDLLQRLIFKTPHLAHPVLFNQQQIEHLFRKIIDPSRNWPCNEGLLQSVIQAWTFCKQWDISDDHVAFNERPQTQQFQTWIQAFEYELKQRNAITEHHIVPYLLQFPMESIHTMIWACFDDYSPLQKKLQHAFIQNHTHLIHHDLPHQASHYYLNKANDEDHEYESLLQWIKTKQNEGKTQIGVVLPDLNQNASRVLRRFKAHFPEDQFNISLGKSLTEYPLMAHALQWLNLNKNIITHHQAELLFHSPYLAHAEKEYLARAELIQKNTLLQETHIPFEAFLKLTKNHTPLLATTLNNLLPYPSSASPYEWSQLFKKRLIDLGFPGEQTLNSLNYQCFQRINLLFDELQTLTLISPILSEAEALHALSSLAKNTVFQPEKKQAPIQLLGLLEASGCTFDCVWVVGMTDQCLPQKPRLSAFIPIELQRSLDMPHATPERELRHAHQLIQRLKNASTEIIFSFPRLSGEQPNLPSPFIADFPLFTQEQAVTSLVTMVETYLFPLQENEISKGGSNLLANQAKCPFRAFAMHRLHVKQEPIASIGPSPLERGIMIHSILEILWKQLKTQQTLYTQTAESLDLLIDHAIQAVLAPIETHKPLSFTPLIQSVEFKRLKRLIHAALEWEKNRPAFEVEALEHAFTLHLAGIEINLQVDRLDRLSCGNKWIIDYKSRLPNTLPWLEERPESPQLLLYALLDNAIRGLIFIELRQGKLSASGLVEEQSSLQGMRTIAPEKTWPAEQAKWHEQLTTLAEEFRDGHCPPTPTHARTCQTCDIQALCRRTVI